MLQIFYVVAPDIRVVADRELIRLYPGWRCIMFHRALFDTVSRGYRLAYTVQMGVDVDDSQVVNIEVFRGLIQQATGVKWLVDGGSS